MFAIKNRPETIEGVKVSFYSDGQIDLEEPVRHFKSLQAMREEVDRLDNFLKHFKY